MNKEAIYEIWAPSEGLWSPWVKPVLFACMETDPLRSVSLELNQDLRWIPSIEKNTALIVDLPSDEGVKWGLALASLGYRPVPLYNAIPKPDLYELDEDSDVEDHPPLVDVEPISKALENGAQILSSLKIKSDAPPAFLLDSNRRIGRIGAAPGCFDNRSISFPTDFPSANFLHAQKIQRVILIQTIGEQPPSDLAHTLLRWQDAGFSIELKNLNSDMPPKICKIQKPSWFGLLCYRFLAAFGFHRNQLGGFGGIIPDPSSGG
jgi:hypothetical protein